MKGSKTRRQKRKTSKWKKKRVEGRKQGLGEK